MTSIPIGRRFAIAGTAVACAGVLLHGQLAAALITRGDDLMRAGDLDGAVRAYARASQLDATSARAADRLAFYLLLRREPGDAVLALRAAQAGLVRHPGNAALLADRGFASLRLHRTEDAARDFAAAARATHDARYARLARRLVRQ